MEPSSLRIGTTLRSNRPSSMAEAARCWLVEREVVDSVAVEPLDRRDEVGRDALGHQLEPLPQRRVAGAEVDRAILGRPARHHLDAGTDDEILMPGLDAHRGERHRLLAGAAEAVERDARRLHRPAGGQHRHPADAHPLVTSRVAVADDDVVDVVRVEPDPIAQGVEHLRQQLLGVDVVERAIGLTPAPRRPHTVDDPCLAHPFLLNQPSPCRGRHRPARRSEGQRPAAVAAPPRHRRDRRSACLPARGASPG